MTGPCDRCGAEEETAPVLGCLAWLCSPCWGDGRHACGSCEAELVEGL